MDTTQTSENQVTETPIKEDTREQLVEKNTDHNKVFAKLRIKDKEINELKTQLEELKKPKEPNALTREEVRAILKEEREAEEKRKQEWQAVVSQKEEELKDKGLTKPQINEVFKYAVELTDWNIDKAYKMWELVGNKEEKKEKPETLTDKGGTAKPLTTEDVRWMSFKDIAQEIKNSNIKF